LENSISTNIFVAKEVRHPRAQQSTNFFPEDKGGFVARAIWVRPEFQHTPGACMTQFKLPKITICFPQF
jgi:hypothetical protein